MTSRRSTIAEAPRTRIGSQPAALARAILTAVQSDAPPYGRARSNGQIVCIDFSSPNIAKPFHIGHMRSTVLGMISAALGSAIGLGNAVLAVVLSLTGSFNGYLLAAAATTFIGSIMFFMLGLKRFQYDVSEPATTP